MESQKRLKEVSVLYEQMLFKKERKYRCKWKIMRFMNILRICLLFACGILCFLGSISCFKHIKKIQSTYNIMDIKQKIPVKEEEAGDTMYITCTLFNEYEPYNTTTEQIDMEKIDPNKFITYEDVSFEPKTEGLQLINVTWSNEPGVLKIGETAQAKYSYILTKEDINKGFVEAEIWANNYYNESERGTKELKVVGLFLLIIFLMIIGFAFIYIIPSSCFEEKIEKEKQQIAEWKHSDVILEYHRQKQYYTLETIKENLKFSYEKFISAGRMMVTITCESASAPFLLSIYGKKGPKISQKKTKTEIYDPARQYQNISLKAEFIKISLFEDSGWTFIVPYWDNTDDWVLALTELTGSIIRNILIETLETAVNKQMPISDDCATEYLLRGKKLDEFFVRKRSDTTQKKHEHPVSEDIENVLDNIEQITTSTLAQKENGNNIVLDETALIVW